MIISLFLWLLTEAELKMFKVFFCFVFVLLNVLVLKLTQKEKNILGHLLVIILYNRLANDCPQAISDLQSVLVVLLEYSHTH